MLVSERVREFGADKPVVGDLVMEKEESEEVVAAPIKTEEESSNDIKMEEDGAESQSATFFPGSGSVR